MKLGKYKHFKGDIMKVIGVAKHSETLEEFVVYKHVTGERAMEKHFWVRPLTMFLEEVELNGEKIKRFEYVES